MRLVKWLFLVLLVAVALLGGGVWLNALPLDDPPGMPVRLFTYLNTHVAETIEGSPFPELRPRHYELAVDPLFAKVKEAVAQLPRWEIVESSDERRDVHAVVTSALFRFKDDVTVTVVPEAGGRPAIMVRAVSRVGKGDLGTNTRHVLNLYEMLEKMGVHGEVERMG